MTSDRRYIAFAIVAAALLGAAGCARKATEPIIGSFLSLTGPTADFGITTRQGIELAIDEINRAGGVAGQKVKIIFEDNRGRPEEARTVATKLIDQKGVVALLGDVASSNSLAAAPVAQMRKIPMVSPSSTNPKVTEKGDYIFRVCFIDPFQGFVMAKFASENLKAKTAALLWDNGSDYSKGLADVFAEQFPKLGGKVVANITYRAGDIDFSSQLTSIRAVKPDVIYVPGYYTEVTLIARKARELGIKAPMLGGDGWDSENLIKRAGDALEGCYFSNHFSADTAKPAVRKFVESYRQMFDSEPNALAALGYDAAWILAEAMKRAGGFESNKVREQLAATKDYPGVTGTITINRERNAVKPAVVLQVRGDKFQYLTTIKP